MVAEFGWSLKRAATLNDLAAVYRATTNAGQDLVAVLFSPAALGLPWEQALRSVLRAAPGALPILCLGFTESIDSLQLADAGVFHSLRLPLDEREVRQSLGFVWNARRGKAWTALLPAATAHAAGVRR